MTAECNACYRASTTPGWVGSLVTALRTDRPCWRHRPIPMVYGMPVIVSPVLPILPTPEEVGRRIARHVFADELAWLGQEVGPAPDEAVHAYRLGDRLVISREAFDALEPATRRG